MSRHEPTPPIRWTVTVTGRSARGIPRFWTFYRTEEARDDAEQVALEEAVSRWPASTKPTGISSYASVHMVRADQNWREVCQWRERTIEADPPEGGAA